MRVSAEYSESLQICPEVLIQIKTETNVCTSRKLGYLKLYCVYCQCFMSFISSQLVTGQQ